MDGEREEHAMKFGARALAAAAIITLLAGSAVAFLPRAAGQEPEPTPATERSARSVAFLERVAALLGVDVAQLTQAVRDAQLEIIDEALASGRIDEEQAARARERVNDGRGLRVRERRVMHERRAQIRARIIVTAATAMGITPEELRASLKVGESIADVAAEQGVPIEDVEAAILDAAKAKLDRAVANGRINQARADELLANLDARLDDVLTRKRAPSPAR
jgi:hypothetical protein